MNMEKQVKMKIHKTPYFSDNSLLKFYKLLDDELIFKKSISYLLFLAKAAQHKDARKSFYTVCCFLSIHNHVNEAFIWSEMYWFWKNSIFFASKNPKQMFKLFEYHLNEQDGCWFGIDDFYQKKYDHKWMLPYKNFYLRIDLYILFMYWINLEHTRMYKYNEYIKNHFFINKSEYAPVRYYLKEFIYRRPYFRPNKLRFRFWTQFLKLRYKLVSAKFINNILINKQNDLQKNYTNGLVILKNTEFKFVKTMEHLPYAKLLKQKNRFFDWAYLSKINLMGNYALALYPNSFMVINRFDWDNYFETTGLFVISQKIFQNFIKVWTGIYIDKMATYTMNSETVSNNLLIDSFCKYVAKVEEFDLNELHNFLYHVFEVNINDFFDQEIIELFITNYFQGRKIASDVASHFSIHHRPIDSRDAKGWMIIFRRYFYKYLILGQYYKVNTFFTRFIFWYDYFYWRIWNAESEYWFLDGRLEFPFLLRKLNLDHIMSNYMVNIWSISDFLIKDYNYILNNNKWYYWRYDYKKMYDNTFYKKTDQYFKLTNWITYSIVKTTYYSIYSASYKLQILTHFLILNKKKLNFFNKIQKIQNKNLQRLIMNFHNLRTAHWIYKYQQTEYRRYLNKNCVISRNTDEYQIIWFSFFHRMRRAGVPKQDMPFYIKERDLETDEEIPHEDYIKSLIEKHKKRKFMDLHKKYWIIEK